MAYRTLAEKSGRLNHLRSEWKNLWESKPERDFSQDEVSSLQSWNLEMDALGEEIAGLESLEQIARDMQGAAPRSIVPDATPKPERPTAIQSTRDILLSNSAYQRFRETERGTAVFEFGPTSALGSRFIHDPELGATTVTLSDAAPQNLRLARIEPYPVETRTVADLMMQGTIDRGTLEYYEETTFTNAAAETAEATSKPEAALDWTLRTETVGKIAVWIPATTEALADVSWLMSTLQNRMAFMVKRREEAELLNGDGTSPNISGITDRSGLQTQAKGTDPVFDAIYKAMTKIQVNAFYDPSAIVMHPNDWQDVRLTRTTDGIYILGNPGDPDAASRLWGLEVRSTTAQTENTAIVGAFSTAAQIFRRTGISVTVSTEHSTFFIDNKVAILAEERLGLAVYRPSAFCTVTGI
jgi:HK97 family phage major capsid protein